MINLRPFKTADTDRLLSYLNDEAVTKYITDAISKPYTQSDAQWWIDVGSQSDYIKAIEFNGVFVGCISATVGSFEYGRSAELGYWLGREYWNQGIATEAVKVFTELLFKTPHIVRLFVSVVAQNGASVRVLEKNGYTHEGLLKQASFKDGQYFDECLLSKVSGAQQ